LKVTSLQEKINDTPLYANVKRVVNKDGTLAAIEINYLTFYAHNGHYDVGYIGLFKVSSHLCMLLTQVQPSGVVHLETILLDHQFRLWHVLAQSGG